MNDRVQPDTRGTNFYAADRSLRELLGLYLPQVDAPWVAPKLESLGARIGAQMDDLAMLADTNPPELLHRDRDGADVQSVRKHPAYEELERLAYSEYELARVSHVPAFGAPHVLHPVTKYALTYLFAQSEFGLLCPVSMTDSLTRTIRRFADDTVLSHCLPGLLENDMDTMWQGAMFMTERHAGSDVGATQTVARARGEHWELTGEKWFCSNADADVALVLARPALNEDAADQLGAGIRGLGLFVLPKLKPDGTRNDYRIVRLKDKLGSRSMASGEISLNGAHAWLVGEPGEGFKQIAEMVNQSRLSNGVRAAGLMRRACFEALAVARERHAFGGPLIDKALMQRQLMKLLLPAEEALVVSLYTAQMLHRTDQGDAQAAGARRILTPLIKFRACRDARKVAGDAMEVRGGCGYIEEFIEPRILRDSHLGSIWEGTSNIVALDVLRATRREQAHNALLAELKGALAQIDRPMATTAARCLDDAIGDVARAASDPDGEVVAREVSTAAYRAVAICINVINAHELEQGGQVKAAARRTDFAALGLSVRFGLYPDGSGASGALERTQYERTLTQQILDALHD